MKFAGPMIPFAPFVRPLPAALSTTLLVPVIVLVLLMSGEDPSYGWFLPQGRIAAAVLWRATSELVSCSVPSFRIPPPAVSAAL